MVIAQLRLLSIVQQSNNTKPLIESKSYTIDMLPLRIVIAKALLTLAVKSWWLPSLPFLKFIIKVISPLRSQEWCSWWHIQSCCCVSPILITIVKKYPDVVRDVISLQCWYNQWQLLNECYTSRSIRLTIYIFLPNKANTKTSQIKVNKYAVVIQKEDCCPYLTI